MKRLSLRRLTNLTQFILVFLPIIIIGIMLLTNSPNNLLRVGLATTLMLFILAVIIQNVILESFLKEVKKIINKLSKAEQGDLTVTTEESGICELNELSNKSGKIISMFNQIISNVYLSYSDVKHILSTVNETSKESVISIEKISKSTEAVVQGATNQA